MVDALLLLAVGLVVLVLGGDLLVRGSAWLAVASGLRPMVVGLTVVAFGTSAPELAASLQALSGGESNVAIGTVLGSNVANIALIIGFSALLWPIVHERGSTRFEVRSLLLVAVLLPLTLWVGRVDRWHGMVMLVGIVLFTVLLLQREMKARAARGGKPADPEDVAEEVPQLQGEPSAKGYVVHIGLVLIGLAGLKFGAQWLLDGALDVAKILGIGSTVVGAVMIALGTSLPELAASISAARRGHPEIVLGNVLGSNLFNVGMVLGITAIVQPLTSLPDTYGLLLLLNFALTAVLAFFLAFRGGVGRGGGVFLLLCYGGFVAWQVLTGQVS